MYTTCLAIYKTLFWRFLEDMNISLVERKGVKGPQDIPAGAQSPTKFSSLGFSWVDEQYQQLSQRIELLYFCIIDSQVRCFIFLIVRKKIICLFATLPTLRCKDSLNKSYLSQFSLD